MPAAALLSNADRTRQAAARATARGHVPRQMPAYQPPDRIEAGYAAALRSMVSRAAERAYAPLIAALPELVARARAERGDAADWRADAGHSGKSASASIRAAKAAMGAELSPSAVAAEAKQAGQDVDRHSKGQVGRQVKQVLGIDLAGAANADQRALVAGFVHENVKLITGITAALAGDVERLVLAGITGGQLHEMLALAIRRRLQVSTNRAELIAVDQIGKINGQVTAARHRALGVTKFKWVSVGDERVRGNPTGLYPNALPSHWARNGKVYLYSDPPKGRNGEPELPGVPIRCRCYPEPIMDDLLGAPVPADPAAPVASVESAEAEAEAARLMAEVEAMLAGKPKPAPAAPPPPPKGPIKVASVPGPADGGYRGVPPARHREVLSTAPVARYAAGNEGINGSYNGVMDPGGGEGMRAKIKPRDEEHPGLHGIPDGAQHLREAAAAAVGRLLNVGDIMPATIVRDLGPPFGRASLQAFHEGAASTFALTSEQVGRIDMRVVARMRVFDFAIGNSDRHGGNVMWADNGRTVEPRLIDHGLTIPPGRIDGFKMPTARAAGASLHPDDHAAIQSFDVSAVARTLAANGIDAASIQGTLYRIAVMQDHPHVIDTRPGEDRESARERWLDAARSAELLLTQRRRQELQEIVRGAVAGAKAP